MNISPLSYHSHLRDTFKSHTKTWEWFSSVNVTHEQLTEFKSGLLKNTYRLDKDEYAGLYSKVEEAKLKLGLDIDVTLYQAQHTVELNASVSYLPGQVHIVFSGNMFKLLSDAELLSVIAHELGHARLFMVEQAEFEVTDRIIAAIANDYRSGDEYIETARLFRLYMELYCDRCALSVVSDLNTVISALVKSTTGLEKISVPGFLKQSEEIFAAEKAQATASTHPENYIRVQALKLWHEGAAGCDEKIKSMIEGPLQMNGLDIYKQRQLKDLTFTLVELVVKPKWMRSATVMSLCHQYAFGFTPNNDIVITDELVNEIRDLSASVKEYLAYVLLDFALVDPSLEELPMGFAFELAENLQLKEALNLVVKKELNLGERKLVELHQRASTALAKVMESNQEHIYEA